MWKGYFSLGGLELANTARLLGYARSSGCPAGWFTAEVCDGFLNAIGKDGGYSYLEISDAPWYDPDIPDRSSRFLGVQILSADNISDSTASAPVTQRVTRGARIGRTREASRTTRFTAVLAAEGMDALEYGYAWLQSTLMPGACGAHGTACGVADLGFFLDCPPVRLGTETEAEYQLRVDEYRLYQHAAARTSGPFTTGELRSRNGIHFGRTIEFAITAEQPGNFMPTRQIAIPPIVPRVIADIAYNLVETPSAEISQGSVLVSTNYSQNPSLETNATDWAAAVAGVSGSAPAGYFTSGRVTGELAAVGTSSFRGRILGNGSTAASGVADITETHVVDLATADATSRPSFTIWAAAVSLGGATGAALTSITVRAQWLTAANAAVGSPVVIGTSTTPADIAGKAWPLSKNDIPATATKVRLEVILRASWSSSATPASNSDIRLYTDAAAVTVP